MDGTQALRWSLYYRLLASLSFVIGLGIAVAGLWIGVGNSIESLLVDLEGGVEQPNSPALAGVGVVVGVLVWQVGKATAFYKTIVGATQSELEDDLDHEAMKSDMLEVIDERLSDMHAEVEQARRGVNRLQQEEHADQLTDQAETSPSFEAGSSQTEGTEASGPDDTRQQTSDDGSPPKDSGSERNRQSSGPSDPHAAFEEE